MKRNGKKRKIKDCIMATVSQRRKKMKLRKKRNLRNGENDEVIITFTVTYVSGTPHSDGRSFLKKKKEKKE